MASAKSHRYGQGGMKHKGVKQDGRPNGKSWKKYPKAFSRWDGKLITVEPNSGLSGTSQMNILRSA